LNKNIQPIFSAVFLYPKKLQNIFFWLYLLQDLISTKYMDIKEYRENILSWYEDRKEGVLIYKHQKLFDITRFIKEVVDIWKKWGITTQEYLKRVDQLFSTMPEEFIKKYKSKYENYVISHDIAAANIAMYTSVGRIKQIQNFFQGVIWDKRALLKYEDIGHFKNKDIEVSQHSTATVVSIKQSYWNKKYGWTSWFVEQVEEKDSVGRRSTKIYTWQDVTAKNKTIEHEYLHILNHQWLMPESFPTDNEIKNKKNISTKSIDTYMKDEFLAWMKWKNIDAEIKGSWEWTDVIIGKLVLIYLGKFMKRLWFTDNEITFDDKIKKITYKATGEIIYEFYFYQMVNGEKKQLPQDVTDILLKKINMITMMYTTYEKLHTLCVPEYYADEDQFIYLLAITPLSRWDELIRTYEQINASKKIKWELYDSLSIKRSAA